MIKADFVVAVSILVIATAVNQLGLCWREMTFSTSSERREAVIDRAYTLYGFRGDIDKDDFINLADVERRPGGGILRAIIGSKIYSYYLSAADFEMYAYLDSCNAILDSHSRWIISSSLDDPSSVI